MISIVISEKGGAERRERYDLNEITIGRVKGNDVLLPKGNVSKRHARLIVRDGRYIVTDLKSTNGTYVNHRRITHATLVREGDRIYIGDFVLRIDGDGKIEQPSQVEVTPDSSTGPRPSYRVSSSGGVPAASAPPEVSMAPHYDVVSHFPIEHDPDESSPSLDVPGPPRIPAGFKPAAQTGEGPAVSDHTGDSYTSRPSASSSNVLSSSGSSAPARSSSHADLDGYHIRQETLAGLVAAVEQAIGVEALAVVTADAALVAKVEPALEAELAKVVEGSLPPGVERGHLETAAKLELLDKGPLGALLDDEAITQVQVLDRKVVVHRRGRRTRFEGFGFATDHGVARALARIAADAGAELEDGPYVELDLGESRSLFAVRPPVASSGHMICIKRAGRAKTTLESLVRSGAISRGMATLLGHCVAARANIVVAGPRNGGAEDVIEALALAVPRRQRAVRLQEAGTEIADAAQVIVLEKARQARDKALEAAVRLEPDHLIAPPLLGQDLARLLDGVTQGAEGLLLHATASTLRHAVDRLATELAGARSGMSTQTAREWIGASFDLGLEVTQLRDGRLRVVRLVELRSRHDGTSQRDIFVFTYHRTAAGGSIEGAFYASGTVPRIVDDLAARGMPLDPAIFRRPPSN